MYVEGYFLWRRGRGVLYLYKEIGIHEYIRKLFAPVETDRARIGKIG